MNSEIEKSEVLNWIQKLKDSDLIHRLFLIKKETEKRIGTQRKAGDGKYLIKYIADDFNDPVDHFDEYKP